MRYPVPPLLFLLLALSPSASAKAPADELSLARARWDHADILEYRMVIQFHCFCFPLQSTPIEVHVVAGEVRRASYVEGFSNTLAQHAPAKVSKGDHVPEVIRSRSPLTVGQVFGAIADAIGAGDRPVDVTYDRALGYPVKASLGAPDGVLDGGLEITISELNHGG